MVGFCDLDDDSIYELFRFLTPSELVKYERTSRRIYYLCNSLQRIQRVVAIKSSYTANPTTCCDCKDHAINGALAINDLKIVPQICQRFPNMKALYLMCGNLLEDYRNKLWTKSFNEIEDETMVWYEMGSMICKLEHLQIDFYESYIIDPMLRNNRIKHLILKKEVKGDHNRLLRLCSNLEYLSCDSNEQYSELDIANLCPNIDSVKLYRIDQKSFDSLIKKRGLHMKRIEFYNSTYEQIITISESCFNLVQLSITFYDYNGPFYSKLRNLERLRFRGHENLLKCFLEGQQKLKYLDSDTVSPFIIQKILMNCPNLVQFKTINLNPADLFNIIPKLKSLSNLYYNSESRDQLMESLESLKKSSHSLKHVVLQFPYFLVKYSESDAAILNNLLNSVAKENSNLKINVITTCSSLFFSQSINNLNFHFKKSFFKF